MNRCSNATPDCTFSEFYQIISDFIIIIVRTQKTALSTLTPGGWNTDVDYSKHCVFNSTCITTENQLLKVKYAFTFETLIYVGTLISQITYIFSQLKLCIAVARHNFKCLKI